MVAFLGRKIYENEFIHIDYWSLLHIALFFIIGKNYPNQWVLVIIGSIIFEIIESIVSKRIIFLKENLKDTLSDLAFNFLGYWMGMKW